ncbi:hypothetical protein [Enterocloster citroniae]|uniref:hypothetical protein n=1 Tax=Enterocloster citroniae TaxID=358743 RepID=UPI0002E20217|nr:hypothetical protein [Enterocloster citroniae]
MGNETSLMLSKGRDAALGILSFFKNSPLNVSFPWTGGSTTLRKLRVTGKEKNIEQ